MDFIFSELAVVNVFTGAIGLLIAGILLQAGLSKLSAENQGYYARTIQSYGVVPEAIALFLAKVIGAAEIAICALILIPATAKIGLLFASCLFAIYLLAFAKQLLQGKADMNCGCGGPGADLKISPMLLLRNATLVGLCLFAVDSQTVTFGIGWIVVIPLAIMLGLVYLSCDQLIANQQKIQLLGNS